MQHIGEVGEEEGQPAGGAGEQQGSSCQEGEAAGDEAGSGSSSSSSGSGVVVLPHLFVDVRSAREVTAQGALARQLRRGNRVVHIPGGGRGGRDERRVQAGLGWRGRVWTYEGIGGRNRAVGSDWAIWGEPVGFANTCQNKLSTYMHVHVSFC